MFITIQWLWERNNNEYATAEKMEKAAYLVNIYKEVIKTSDCVLIQPSSNFGTGGKVISKLYRNIWTCRVNPEILRTTKKSLTSTPKALDCERPVNINKEQLAYSPITPRVSTPNAVNKNAQESSFTDSAHPSRLPAPVTVNPKNSDFLMQIT